MTLLRTVTHGLRALVHQDLAERDAADEVEHYLREAAKAHRARGLSEQEALRAARLELGSPVGVREEVRRHGCVARGTGGEDVLAGHLGMASQESSGRGERAASHRGQIALRLWAGGLRRQATASSTSPAAARGPTSPASAGGPVSMGLSTGSWLHSNQPPS